MQKEKGKVNKKYRKRMMIGGALGAVTLATTGVASAHLGKTPETRQAVRAAFESKSFSAFQDAAKDTGIIEKIDTEEKFNKLIEAKELRDEGRFDEAHVLKEELGLDLRKHGHGKKSPEIRAAIETNDYTAFQEALQDGKFAQKVDTAQKFATLVQVNELRSDGKYEEARALMEELGFDGKGHRTGNRGADRGGDRDGDHQE